jgi:hypothetical protein
VEKKLSPARIVAGGKDAGAAAAGDATSNEKDTLLHPAVVLQQQSDALQRAAQSSPASQDVSAKRQAARARWHALQRHKTLLRVERRVYARSAASRLPKPATLLKPRAEVEAKHNDDADALLEAASAADEMQYEDVVFSPDVQNLRFVQSRTSSHTMSTQKKKQNASTTAAMKRKKTKRTRRRKAVLPVQKATAKRASLVLQRLLGSRAKTTR